MAKRNADEVFVYFHKLPDVQKKRPMLLTLGILLVILGILAILFSGWTTLLTVEILGFFLIIGGIFLLANCFQVKKWVGVSLSVILGLLYIFVGAICVFKPMVGAEVLTILLAIFFFIGGLSRILSALSYRVEHWGVLFFNGLVALILGLLIFLQWPTSALWIIGLFVGIDILLTGITWIYLASLKRSK